MWMREMREPEKAKWELEDKGKNVYLDKEESLLGWVPCFQQTNRQKPTKNEDGVFQCCSFCTFYKLPLFKKMFGQVL